MKKTAITACILISVLLLTQVTAAEKTNYNQLAPLDGIPCANCASFQGVSGARTMVEINEQNSLFGSFIDDLVRMKVYEEIRRQYNISENTPVGYASNTGWVQIKRGTKGDHEISLKIKPHNAEHYDRVTFSVKARNLMIGHGITLLKYEKAVEK